MRCLALFTLFLPLIFSACAPKSGALLSSTPKILLINVPQFKFYDLGFVKHYENRLSLEAHSLAQAGIVIDIWSDSICINGDCFSKERVNREIFGARVGYKTLLEEIILGRDIFQGKGKRQMGMEGDSHKAILQEIKTSNYHIFYERSQGGIIFQERMRKITFAIKEIPRK